MAFPIPFQIGFFISSVILVAPLYLLARLDEYLYGVRTTTPSNDDGSPESVVEESVVETRDALPAHFLTRIESFSLLSEYGIEKYETREFVAGDHKWRLVIYPNGKEKGDHASVSLSISETISSPEHWEINVTFTIFLYNHFLAKYCCFRVNETCFNKTKSEWGFPKFISKKELTNQSSGYLVDDNFVLGAEVLVIKKHRIVETVTLLKPTENPQKRDWKIQEFCKLEEDTWISEEFSIRNVKWKMKIYPNDGELSMDLVCVSADTFASHQKVKAEFYMRLKGKPGVVRSSGKLAHWFTSSDKSWGIKEFISFATLRNPEDGFLVDDCCTLQIEICVQLVV